MTFYQQVRGFFKKYDPSRIRLSKRIAQVYRTPASQKAAMKRLREVYAAGGPDKFSFPDRAKAIDAAKTVVADVVETVTENNNSEEE